MHWIALQPQPEPALPDVATAVVHDPLTVLGWWALQYTPKVARLADSVLLEVSASERLWGGRAGLLRHVYMSKKPVALMGYAQGATSLVAFGRLFADRNGAFPADDLPLAALLAARPHLPVLARIGCNTWGQLRALPRGGLARRFGAELLNALDQAYGSRPDVYPWVTLPDSFDSQLELVSPVENAQAMLFGAQRLLAQLRVWLQLRQLGVLAIELGWTMDERRHTDTHGAVVIRSAQASADTAHLMRLLAERLAQVNLAAPVHSLHLRSHETQALTGASNSLVLDEQVSGHNLLQTLERLSARLGPDKVLQLQARADYRPECRQTWVAATHAIESRVASAHAKRAAGHFDDQWACALWPTWLLAEPLQLALHQQQPCYQGPLTLLAGPQRLETGWWPSAASDTASSAALRDYFVARGANSVLLWIFRERLGHAQAAQPSLAWYLHGIFA